MIREEFLKLLICPESRQPLHVAEQPLIDRLNQQVRDGVLQNKAGQRVEQPFQGALIREDEQVLYPIIDDIPVLLVDEGILVDQASPQRDH